MNKFANIAIDALGKKVDQVILTPFMDVVDENIAGTVTTIGSFVIKKIQSKYARTISFSTSSYKDRWMEEALYVLLYRYNDIRRNNNVKLSNHLRSDPGESLYCKLNPGTHHLKYRNYNIILVIKNTEITMTHSIMPVTSYTLITYSLDNDFVTDFEKDMLASRNKLFKIRPDSPTLQLWNDGHENDGYTYWMRGPRIPKRRLSSIYIPDEQKRLIVDSINRFVASKDEYHKLGIPWNLTILLEGPPGTGKDSIAKMIASEWNREIMYITGGKKCKFIPNAITDNSSDNPENEVLLISDIDKIPFIINEANIDLNDDQKSSEEALANKQLFGQMINALDGAMSPEGRIIIMTTNHIEKFSPTFLRHGRVDLNLHIGYVTTEVFRKYVYSVYNEVLPEDVQLKSKKTTVAEMQYHAHFLKKPFELFYKEFVK